MQKLIPYTGRPLRQDAKEAIERVLRALQASGGFRPISPEREARILAVRRSVSSLT